MDDKIYKRERIRQARLERLGTNNPKCLLCPENNTGCLELHHLAGRRFSDIQVIICRNCHRKLTDKQKDQPPLSSDKPHIFECHGRLLLGIADALELSGASMHLIEFIRQTGMSLIEDLGEPSNQQITIERTNVKARR